LNDGLTKMRNKRVPGLRTAAVVVDGAFKCRFTDA